ncbi:MAG: PadR family transcriptional regulator [Armatimonadota bacterium]
MCKGQDHRHCVCMPARLPRLLEPALLLALAESGERHGYELLAAVNQMELAENEVDPGAVYRALRQLESDGYLVSSWHTGETGPARRVYRLTPAGRELLWLWAETLRRRHAALAGFLERCTKVAGPDPRP